MLLRTYIRHVVRLGGAIPPRVRIVIDCMWKAGWRPKAAAAYLRKYRAWNGGGGK